MTAPTTPADPLPFNATGMLHAHRARFTRLRLDGSAAPGPLNRFVTDALISINYTMAYNKQEDISITRGDGTICTTYSPPQTLLRLDVSDINFCYPDPRVIEFLCGGVILTRTIDGQKVAKGYAAPPVGRDPKPEGVAMELICSQIEEGAITGYTQWLMPRAKLQFTKDQQLNGTDPYNTGMDGICLQNKGFGAGVGDEYADWALTERVYQWMQLDETPEDGEWAYGYHEVAA